MTQGSKLSPDADVPSGTQTGRQGKRSATLPERILNAFHAACDKRDIEIAESLLRIFEFSTCGPGQHENAGQHNHSARQHAVDSLVAAHERLWNLKQANQQLYPIFTK